MKVIILSRRLYNYFPSHNSNISAVELNSSSVDNTEIELDVQHGIGRCLAFTKVLFTFRSHVYTLLNNDPYMYSQ